MAPERTEPERPTGWESRLCARVGCAQVARYTLTADYTDRMMAVGPLSPERTPPALDLCERHAESLAPPEGWQLVRHSSD
ncbi:DUF3499 family protein [Leucobacter sp. UT-8R-CII-1-4]|uniref:DUF3499 family protein n=1 Tax=Leucobacter sp. UT-8R-CII-1-4 TaxID=3040075 RepID=UPI0024A944B5|nr:DUF3499 family protein [Leucobacter sp. UT-8R-CII-1-4]MDI6023778.1 DUF3499 family protein [Leucobacter sp. UT-8R-CII-1-4]